MKILKLGILIALTITVIPTVAIEKNSYHNEKRRISAAIHRRDRSRIKDQAGSIDQLVDVLKETGKDAIALVDAINNNRLLWKNADHKMLASLRAQATDLFEDWKANNPEYVQNLSSLPKINQRKFIKAQTIVASVEAAEQEANQDFNNE